MTGGSRFTIGASTVLGSDQPAAAVAGKAEDAARQDEDAEVGLDHHLDIQQVMLTFSCVHKF